MIAAHGIGDAAMETLIPVSTDGALIALSVIALLATGITQERQSR